MPCKHEWAIRIDWTKKAPESKTTVCRKCGEKKR